MVHWYIVEGKEATRGLCVDIDRMQWRLVHDVQVAVGTKVALGFKTFTRLLVDEWIATKKGLASCKNTSNTDSNHATYTIPHHIDQNTNDTLLASVIF